ncbi:hypothetical protein [Lentibacillus sp. Marseille-P4043]|uniref:hypothetical protein n=1 Tax=Lentibacillus sp. Marseille-P4043 TaxID=2040293 RepID=UPI000D0BAEE2|nr:hypothetical protein [Lentibacillus sp. Marseille-P4043]
MTVKLEKQFLPDDIYRASQEYWCSLDLQCMIAEKLVSGDFDAAKNMSIDLTKSLHELSKMSDKKHDQDELNTLMDELIQQGVAFELVRRYSHER